MSMQPAATARQRPRLWSRRTVRLRLTALYGTLFLLSGAVLLAIAGGLLVGNSTTSAHVDAPPTNAEGQTSDSALTQDRSRIRTLEKQLAAEHEQASSGIPQAVLESSLVALGVMAVVSVALGWGVAGRVLRPLREMTAATRRFSADSLHERLGLSGPADEVKELADTIDELLERLEGAFVAQRRFVANASHELRTPLATIRASLDVAVAKPEPVPAQTTALAGRLHVELDRIDGLLDGLLALARAQHGDLPGRTTLSLDAVVSATLATRAEAITAAGLTVRYTSGPGGAWVEGSQELVCRMVDNVMENAIVHNDEGGWIQVVTGTRGPLACLTVETGGKLLDQEQVEQLIQPFRRLRADRTGSDNGAGLGLSIVAAVAEAHGGTLDLTARAGGGLRVSIALPPAQRFLSAGDPV